MHIDFTPPQIALREQLRRYMTVLMTPELTAEVAEREAGGPLYHQAMNTLGKDGWLGLGWDPAYGGRGMGPIEEFIFFDEMHRSGFPIPLLTLCTVGPTLAKHGTDEQREAFLPRILRGNCHFSIAYTEPNAGTDLASLETRAVRSGDEYVLNGQKVFISLASHADMFWLAARTNTDVPKHKGISILMVPRDAPGLSSTPIQNVGDNDIHALYLSDVRVPVSMRVGPEDGGWRLITTQLNHERVALMMVGPLTRFLEETLDWARETPAGGGKALLDLAWVRRNLAEVAAHLEVLELMNWRQAWNLGKDRLTMEEASAIKVFGSEFYVEAYRLLMEVFGEAGVLRRGSRGAALKGHLERHYRATLVLTFGGGTNEVQRDIIATAGLRLPRSRR